nr:recombinase family protein [Polyangium spumosum]
MPVQRYDCRHRERSARDDGTRGGGRGVVKGLQSWDDGSPPPARWWAFYVRVTSEESMKRDLSIPNQCARSREIARLRGWQDYRIYVEPRKVSAELWTEKRPALKELLDDIAAGRIQGVCARHTDRQWRNNEIQARILSALRAHGVQLWDFSNQFDYKSAHGRFSLQVLGAASELEVGLAAERIREMKRGKALKGKVGGGPAPFGYTSQARRIKDLEAAGLSRDEAYRKACLDYPVGKCWYVDAKEAEIVRLIFELYTSHEYRYGCKRIALYLNHRGYVSRTGIPFRAVFVLKILDNPVYAGFTTFDEAAYADRVPSQLPRSKQTLYQGEHEALITHDIWNKAQQIRAMESRSKRVREGRPSGEVFSLTGILRCPECGSPMIGKAASRNRYYICHQRHASGAGVCAFPLVRATDLQQTVWTWVHELLSSPALVLPSLAELNRKLEAEQPEARRALDAAKRQRDKLKATLAKYFRTFEASTDIEPDRAFVERVRELRAELQTVETEIGTLEPQVTRATPKLGVAQVQQYLAKLRERMSGRAELQRALFQDLKREHDFQVCMVSPTELTLSLALPLREMAMEKDPAVQVGQRVVTVLRNKGRQEGSRGHGSTELRVSERVRPQVHPARTQGRAQGRARGRAPRGPARAARAPVRAPLAPEPEPRGARAPGHEGTR